MRRHLRISSRHTDEDATYDMSTSDLRCLSGSKIWKQTEPDIWRQPWHLKAKNAQRVIATEAGSIIIWTIMRMPCLELTQAADGRRIRKQLLLQGMVYMAQNDRYKDHVPESCGSFCRRMVTLKEENSPCQRI